MNIAGLTTNYVSLRQLVESSQPLLVLLSETHITEPEAFDQYSIPGYKVVFCLSHSRHTGGVAIYYKESIYLQVCLNEFSENNWFLGITVEKGMNTGNYGILYHSPSSSDQRFIQILENWLENFLDMSKFNLIAGDFNINWLDEQNCTHLKSLTEYLGLTQKVAAFTRITRNSRTLIDCVFSNIDCVKAVVKSEWKITDHETLVITISDFDLESPDDRIKIKSWKNYTPSALCNLLERRVNFRTLTGELDFKSRILTNTLKNCTNELVTTQYINKKDSNSWYNGELMRLKQKRDKLYKKFCRTNNTRHWKKYTVARNRYSKSLKTTRSTHIQNNIERNKNNSKELWKILKKLMKSKDSLPRTILFGDIEECSDDVIASKFNNYFIESVVEINESIERTDEPVRIRNMTNRNCRLEIFNPVTYVELKQIVFELGSSAGIDNINAKVLKDCFHVIGYTLLEIINESLLSGQVPTVWKESLVIPIQKVAGTKKAEEFRPINMLHTLEKILETVVKTQLLEYLNINKLLIPEQSGYREGHSCETALNLVLAKWKEFFEDRNSTLAVFLDLKRAFETISRPLLLKTLRNFGIGGAAFKWFKNYLNLRTQRTIFNDAISETRENNLGVPQGSVLGPILFIMYINDMKLVLRHCDINLFADDTVIFVAAKNPVDAVLHLNEDLDALSKWLKFKQLKLNINKTKYMIISSRYQNIHDAQIAIDGEQIDRVHSIKYLGVTIDENLKFNIHIDNTIKKIAKKYGIMCRLKNDLNFQSKIQLYKSIISPHLDFCSSIIFLANETQLSRLQRLQNKIMRLILKCNRFTSSTWMLDALQWLSVKQRIIFSTMIFVFKLINGLLPRYLCDRILRGSDLHDHFTRNADAPRTPNFLFGAAQNSLFYKGVNIFNSMPRQIKQSTTIAEFKRRCCTHIKLIF